MGFWSTILISASTTSIAAIGLFLQIRSGQLNVGMAVFVGVGGYTSGALALDFGLSPLLTVPLAVVAGFVAGVLFSSLTLRLHHWFFSVVTLALTVAAVSGVSMFDGLGGGIGLMGLPLVNSPLPILGGLALSIAVACAIDYSHVGMAIRATGDDQVLAQFFGVRVKRLRVLVFGVGSALAALAGALQAHRFGLYEPADLGFQNSMLLFVYVLVGGKGNVVGPVLGSFFLYTMPELLNVAPETELLVFGALMVLVGVAAPDGLVGLAAWLYRAMRGLPARRALAASTPARPVARSVDP